MASVQEAVAAYKRGDATLDELADDLAHRRWVAPPKRPDDPAELWGWAEDKDLYAPGTWNGEVHRLLDTGALTVEEYQTILQRLVDVHDGQASSG